MNETSQISCFVFLFDRKKEVSSQFQSNSQEMEQHSLMATLFPCPSCFPFLAWIPSFKAMTTQKKNQEKRVWNWDSAEMKERCMHLQCPLRPRRIMGKMYILQWEWRFTRWNQRPDPRVQRGVDLNLVNMVIKHHLRSTKLSWTIYRHQTEARITRK